MSEWHNGFSYRVVTKGQRHALLERSGGAVVSSVIQPQPQPEVEVQDHPPDILLRNGRGTHARSLGFLFELFEARPTFRIIASLG